MTGPTTLAGSVPEFKTADTLMAVYKPPTEWTNQWRDLVLAIVDPSAKADAATIDLFFYRARQLKIDPLSRQLYILQTPQGPTFYMGIHGMRMLAERTGERGPETVTDEVRTDAGLQEVTVRVVRFHGSRADAYEATARIKEAKPKRELKEGESWARQPDLMLTKTAASMAYRMAFPDVLADVYSKEELGE